MLYYIHSYNIILYCIGSFKFAALDSRNCCVFWGGGGVGDHNFEEKSCHWWISHTFIVQCGLPC